MIFHRERVSLLPFFILLLVNFGIPTSFADNSEKKPGRINPKFIKKWMSLITSNSLPFNDRLDNERSSSSPEARMNTVSYQTNSISVFYLHIFL